MTQNVCAFVSLSIFQIISGPEGEVPAKDLAPHMLRVACSEGTENIDLTLRQTEEP